MESWSQVAEKLRCTSLRIRTSTEGGLFCRAYLEKRNESKRGFVTFTKAQEARGGHASQDLPPRLALEWLPGV